MELGINVDFDWGFDPNGVADAGSQWARVILRPDQDPNYLQTLATRGVKTLGLIVNESRPGDVSYTETARYYRDRLSGLLVAVQALNEPDGATGGASQSEDAESFLSGVYEIANVFAGVNVPTVAGGFASGQPDWASAIAVDLSQCTIGKAIHPYGQRPSDDWPSADWGYGTYQNILDAYRPLGGPFWITEFGYKRGEMNGDPHMHAESVTRAILALREQPDVVAAMLFCWSQKMYDEFGIIDQDDRQTESYAAYAGALAA